MRINSGDQKNIDVTL